MQEAAYGGRYALAPVMRAALLLLALVALGGAVMWFARSGALDAPPGVVAPVVPDTGDALGRPALGPNSLPDGVEAARTAVVEIDPGRLADRPTVCLRVVEHVGEEPVVGAVVRRLATGADLAFTDERGLAFVPLEEPAQLAVVAEGFLLRLAPARPGSDEQDPQTVRLVSDAWSCVRRFEFVDSRGRPVDDVFVRFAGTSGLSSSDGRSLSAMDPIEQRAWSEHLMMVAREVSRDQNLHAGAADDHVYRSRASALAVRFAASGRYQLQAATTSGLVAAAAVQVRSGPEPPAQVVQMTAGVAVAGRVTDTAGVALSGARVTLRGGDPLGLTATTGVDGAFEIGPLPSGVQTLLVRHALHRPAAVEAVPAPSRGRRIRLEPLQRTPLRGCVRTRPGLQPVPGATVIWQVAGGGAVTTRTGVDGTFALLSAGDIAARLIIQAPRHLTYSELVDPGAGFANYDLLPATTDERVASGLTATFEGVLFGPGGFPLGDASVRWRPSNAVQPPVALGRRVLDGAIVDLPNVIKTDAAGAFVLETARFGDGYLVVNGPRQLEYAATATAGQRLQGLELGR